MFQLPPAIPLLSADTAYTWRQTVVCSHALRDTERCSRLYQSKGRSDGRAVSFASFHFIVHTDIHIHLTYITMGDLFGL